jgi:hypothetical protein
MISFYLIQRSIMPSDIRTLDDWIINHEIGEDPNQMEKNVYKFSAEKPEGKGPLTWDRNK